MLGDFELDWPDAGQTPGMIRIMAKFGRAWPMSPACDPIRADAGRFAGDVGRCSPSLARNGRSRNAIDHMRPGPTTCSEQAPTNPTSTAPSARQEPAKSSLQECATSLVERAKRLPRGQHPRPECSLQRFRRPGRSATIAVMVAPGVSRKRGPRPHKPTAEGHLAELCAGEGPTQPRAAAKLYARPSRASCNLA